VGLGVGVYLAMRAGVGRPLRRLVEGMDAVGEGDLSRVILVERDDEIGRLASRFNAMTASLREARQETGRSAEARLALENRLHQSEKLATIGQLAAEIAHEVGTPLNVIVGRARSISRKASDATEVTKNAEIITAQAGRITRIIQKVLDFSRKRGPTLSRVHLGAIVAESLEFLSESIRRQGIEVVAKTMPSPDVPGDPDQLQQVCLNLLMNAVQAMPHGGRLTVGLRVVTRRKEGLDLAAPAPYALLEIADTGPGVPAAERDKVFEPFFTTKSEGQGTGLGLAVSLGIVREHDGWIEVLDAKEAARHMTPALGIGLPGKAAGPEAGRTLTPVPVASLGAPLAAGVVAPPATAQARSEGTPPNAADEETLAREVSRLARLDRSGPREELPEGEPSAPTGAVFRVYLPLGGSRGTPAVMDALPEAASGSPSKSLPAKIG
jgi:signal transduction histidine kinase